MTLFMTSLPQGKTVQNGLLGIILGTIFTLFLIGMDQMFKKITLRSLNIALLGCLIGYLMGKTFFLIFEAALEISSLETKVNPSLLELLKVLVFLMTTYLGAIITLRSSDELYISIPFVHFTPLAQKKKDLIIDTSALLDSRIIDLALTGLVDHTLIIPQFIVKNLQMRGEKGEDLIHSKARDSLEVLKKLESILGLELRYHETDFPEIKELGGKIVRLAHLLDANILTSDTSRIQSPNIEGVRVINLQALSNALQPLMQGGEHISIKIQRLGKEAGQGVGYLEDGSMVVVNGSSDRVGKTVEGRVLSVKHTSSGRIVFCNLTGGEEDSLFSPTQEKLL
ncbi:PIN/TRAM domain-containing protein [Rhabdochlamydiaceae symbiont of Dictyostelium giganteum]|uniref:PIN/TRAM domain-containing protein n=1 Tax=Rhabdochlamydiaceae symbiont of Dictyostelium giganteum TaxID=3342349 RepID=UPI0038517D75